MRELAHATAYPPLSKKAQPAGRPFALGNGVFLVSGESRQKMKKSKKLQMAGKMVPARPSHLSRESVERIAEAVAAGVRYEPDMALSHLVGGFGGELLWRDYFESKETGSIEIRDESDFDIFLPLHTSALMNRFTVAHELGHYILHYLWPKRRNHDMQPTYASRYGSDQAEWEANWFAAAFLMPRDKLADLWRSGDKSAADVAGTFAVSTSAAISRLKRLNLLNAQKKASARQVSGD